MRQMFLYIFVISAIGGGVFAWDEPKPKAVGAAEADLANAQKDYDSAVDAARKTLLAAFDEQKGRLEKDTKLKLEALIKLVEKLDGEKKEFEADPDKLPTSASMKAARLVYLSSLSKAKANRSAAFDKAADAYRSKKDLTSAKTVLAEKAEFLNSVTKPPFQQKKGTGCGAATAADG